jgi:hypothetical protein
MSAVFLDVRGQVSTYEPIPGTQWAARFNGPANENDRRPVMALDAQGNVYIAAETKSLTPPPPYGMEGVNCDIVTIKYDQNGGQLWAATFNGPGQYIDSPKDIGVDAQGNVFVTGYAWGGRNTEGGTGYDFVTIKYDANGHQQWVRYYSGTQARSQLDQAYALDLDQAGNIYVTGGSFYNGVNDWLLMQFATIKYDTQGNQIWVRNFDGEDRAGSMPNDIKVDASGNIFVGGIYNYLTPANTYESNFVLLKYGPTGNLLRQGRYDTPGDNDDDEDRADRMHLDAQGNVYLLGDSRPNLYGDNYTAMDSVLMKFSNDCSLVWARVYTRQGESLERGLGVVTDSAGNVYVTGVTDGGQSFVASFTIKYDSGGGLLWERVLDLSLDDADFPVGMVISPAEESIYLGVIALSDQANTHYDYTVVRYLADGTQASVNKYDNSVHSDDALSQILIDKDGNLYLTGTMRIAPGTTATFDLLTIKVRPNSYTLSGVVTNAAGQPLPGVVLTLNGAADRTVTTGADGRYAFQGLGANGRFTVKPSLQGYTFIPVQQEVVLTQDQTANFTGVQGVTISGRVADSGGTGIAGVSISLSGSKSATTSTDNDGAYSFAVEPGGSYTVTPSSAFHTFTPANSTFNSLTQSQTGNFVGQLKLYLISGNVTLAGAGVGGVTLSLTSTTPGFTPRSVTTAASTGAFSFGSLPAGQDYLVTPSSNIYSFTPIYRSYSKLAANQTAQTFSATRKSYTIVGTVLLGAAGLGGAKLTLTSTASGFTPQTVTTLSDGSYSFTALPAGFTYKVTPVASSVYSFTPASRSYSSLTASQAGQNFMAAYKTYTISGNVLQGSSGLSGVSLTLTSTTAGFTPRAVASAASTGAYAFTNLPAGRTYIVTPSSSIYTFTPVNRMLSSFASNQTGQNFTVASRKTYSISGRVTRAGTTTGIGGVTMTLTNGSTGAVVKTVPTRTDGSYSLTAIPAGITYVLRPTKAGVTFSPASRTYTNLSANQPIGSTTGFTGP